MPPLSSIAALEPRARLLVRVIAGVMLAVLAAHLIHTSTGAGGVVGDEVIDRWGVNLGYAAAFALCVMRVRASADGRGAWLAIAIGLGLYGAGNAYYSVVLYTVAQPPFPSPADAGWLAFYPAAYACLGLLARDSARRVPVRVWLDAALVALAVAAIGVTAVVVPVFSGLSGSTGEVVTTAAYPVGDLVLLSSTIGIVALHGWRGRALLALAAGFMTLAVADSLHIYRALTDSFQPGTVLDSLWLLGATLMGLAAWQHPKSSAAPEAKGATLVMPFGFGLIALAVLTVAGLRPVEPIAVVLAAAAVAVSMLRTALSFRALRAFGEARRQATTDELTELPNRRAFDRRLRIALERAAARNSTLAVMVIDLDHFKDVNDTLGHHAGDLVLEQVGPRLRSALRSEDVLARLGGDEFAVLIPNAQAAEAAASRIAAALQQSFSIDGIDVHVGASVGIALHPEHGSDAETLMRRADVAMYLAKEDRTGIETYARERDRNTRRRLELIADLRAAVQARALILHYQPKVDLRTGNVTGAEALLRWPHPTRGNVRPDEFIPLAEQAGVMRPLTEFVLNEAVRQAAAWRAAGLDLDVAVNVSATSLLDAGWTDTVTAVLAHHRLPAKLLTVEITENAVAADPERAIAAVQALADSGVRVSIDDFGTGNSSLARLKQLHIAELKIDRSFVRDLAADPTDAAIVKAIAQLAQSLGLALIAEGVQDAEALSRLTAFGANGAQGFLFSPALPPDRFIDWLHDRPALAAA